MIINKLKHILLLFIALTAAAPARAGMLDVSINDEKKMGEEVAQSVIDEYGLVETASEEDRLAHVGAALVKASGQTTFEYHFYIADTDQVNAFALPGGYVFVTRGMMDFVDDDDELAAVVGHEIVHVTMRHGVVLFKKSMRSMVVNLLLLLLTQEPNLVLANEMYQQGKSEIYGRRAELESDRIGMDYMKTAGYDPAAQSRLMQKLGRIEQHKAPIFEGYFEVHPPTDERVGIINSHLKELHADTSRISSYKVRGRLFTQENCTADNAPCTASIMNGPKPILTLTAHDGGLSPYDRARDASITLNRLLDSGLQIYEISSKPSGDTPAIWAKDNLIIKVLPEDSVTPGDASGTADLWMRNIKNFIWSSLIKDEF